MVKQKRIEARKRLPEISRYLESTYSCSSNLYFGNTIIKSEAGVQQGDPMAGLGFALVLQPVIEAVEEAVPDLIQNSWFADDGNLVGGLDSLREAFDVITMEGQPRGLNINLTKTLIWHKNMVNINDPISRGITFFKSPGIIVLGAPVGTITFKKEALEARIMKVEKILDLLPNLEDPHGEYCLLRSCF